MRKLTFLWACLFLIGVGLANAQSKSVSGKVLSAEDGEPIIGASVIVKGNTSTGTITGVDGGFTLSIPGSAKTLVISYVGMKNIEVEAKSGLIVKMESDALAIDEVVVVGYGTQRKKDLTSSIARVGGTEISNLATASFDTQLAGRAAGV
ncbi:MAG: carboxypeptidase-like regulatory domain-containing protein, partial [Paludibacter sp.]